MSTLEKININKKMNKTKKIQEKINKMKIMAMKERSKISMLKKNTTNN